MKIYKQFYINGKWVDPVKKIDSFDVLNPANEKVIGQVSLGTPHDVDSAVISARNAFNFFSQTSVEDRLTLLERIIEVYESRYDEVAETISLEMGAPISI